MSDDGKYELGAGDNTDDLGHDDQNMSRELDKIEDVERFPVPDPGIEEHIPRLTDIDEKAADRAT
ncbi:MAG: hypothetical protein ABWY56_06440, partial [Propionibacteriaceae bacterium]